MKDKTISETPEKWVIIRLINSNDTYYKIFGSWNGGYLDEDRWKLNSGIKSVEEDEENYYFIGFSGSYYKCNKKMHGTVTLYGLSILNTLTEHYSDKIEVLYKKSDWINEFNIGKYND